MSIKFRCWYSQFVSFLHNLSHFQNSVLYNSLNIPVTYVTDFRNTFSRVWKTNIFSKMIIYLIHKVMNWKFLLKFYSSFNHSLFSLMELQKNEVFEQKIVVIIHKMLVTYFIVQVYLCYLHCPKMLKLTTLESFLMSNRKYITCITLIFYEKLLKIAHSNQTMNFEINFFLLIFL